MALASLCACGGGPGGPGGGGLFGGGGGFFGGGSTRLALAPIFGAPPNVAEQMTQALVEAGKDRKLILIPGNDPADYTLRGYLVASTEKKGAKISYIWDITDAKGGRVGRVSGDEIIPTRSGSDPWSGVDSAVLRSIAGKTASQVAASLPRGGGGAPTTVSSGPPVAPGPAGGGSPSRPPGASPSVAATPRGELLTLVTPVAGAPGDGQTSLAAALKKRLSAGGVKLANAPTRNVYTVKGIVSVTDLAGGKQSIHIDWQVLAPGGKKLGTVTQRSTFAKGSLNGPWGAIADAAAGDAAGRILKILHDATG